MSVLVTGSMSPLGRRIMAAKRKRANAALAGDRKQVWDLTLYINALVRGR